MAGRGKPKKLNAEQLWDFALASLGRRAQSAAELRRKLVSRADSPQAVTLVMSKLADYRIADDARFSEAFASSRLQNKGLGKMRVMRDLRARQVPERVASAAVEKAYQDTEEPQLIEAYLSRRYRNQDLREFLKDPKNLAAAYRRLRTAGFRSGPSLDALKRHTAMPEDWAEPDESDEENGPRDL